MINPFDSDKKQKLEVVAQKKSEYFHQTNFDVLELTIFDGHFLYSLKYTAP